MSDPLQTTIVNVGYRSTNYWVVSSGTSRLLVDLGWPGTMGQMLANLRRMDVPLDEIKFGLATHYHIDHAGLAQELKQLGVRLLVMDAQVNAIPTMKKWTKPQDKYIDIDVHDNIVASFAESRSVLQQIGIKGKIVHTPGHSNDSVSLLLDDGRVFTGDLTRSDYADDCNSDTVTASWRRLRELGGAQVYPAHGPTHPIAEELLQSFDTDGT